MEWLQIESLFLKLKQFILFFSIIFSLVLFTACGFSEESSSTGGSSQNKEQPENSGMDLPKSGLNFKMIKKAVSDYFSSKKDKSKNSDNPANSTDQGQSGELGKGSKGGKGGANPKGSDPSQEGESENPEDQASLEDFQETPQFPSQSSSDSPSDDSDPEERKPRNRHKPNSVSETHFKQGESLQKSSKCKQAIESFEKSVEADPLFVAPLDGISSCYLELKQFEKAKLFREMSDSLLSIHMAESARDLNPPLFLKEWRKRSAYEKLSRTEKSNFDKKYSLLTDHPILMDLSILTGWSNFAKEMGSRFSETQKDFYKKHEKAFYGKAALTARNAFTVLPKKLPVDNPDFVYYQTVFLLWEIKNLYWGENFRKVKELCESYQSKFPERYAEEEMDYWYYQPSLEKLAKK
jgi:hypothetical protein